MGIPKELQNVFSEAGRCKIWLVSNSHTWYTDDKKKYIYIYIYLYIYMPTTWSSVGILPFQDFLVQGMLLGTRYGPKINQRKN
jgi:hypothetical protein